MTAELAATIDAAWDDRDQLTHHTTGPVRESVEIAIRHLDEGTLRIAKKGEDGDWQVNQWLKKAVLLSFRLRNNELVPYGSGGAAAFDKVQSKFDYWTADTFHAAGFRVVPGAVVRRGAYIGKGAVLMPSFVNIGAHVGEGTMIDTWATVGSCAQIGKGVHLSGGVGIGGVLEPPQASPVIVEDGAFIGSRCIVVEGVRIEREAVLGAGVVLTASTPIVDVRAATAVTSKGRIPPRAIVIPGTIPKVFPAGEYGVPCALIIGTRSEATDRKTSLNTALRDFEVPV